MSGFGRLGKTIATALLAVGLTLAGFWAHYRYWQPMQLEKIYKSKLVLGSGSKQNDAILKEDGWIRVSDFENCGASKDDAEYYYYVLERDPSFTLAIRYSNYRALTELEILRRKYWEL